MSARADRSSAPAAAHCNALPVRLRIARNAVTRRNVDTRRDEPVKRDAVARRVCATV